MIRFIALFFFATAANAVTYLPLNSPNDHPLAQRTAPFTYALSLSGDTVVGVCGYAGYHYRAEYACTWQIVTDANGKVSIAPAVLGELYTAQNQPAMVLGKNLIKLPNSEWAWQIGNASAAGDTLVIYDSLPYQSFILTP